MGAWGYGAFENDDASDWIYELEDDSDGHVLIRALDVAGKDYLEAPEGAVTIAAAEVVAAAQGRSAGGLPDEATAWVKANRSIVRPEYRAAALVAVDRVLSDGSELRDLWSDSEDGGDKWIAALEDLRRRLREST